jgi:hypothetical protein
VDVALAPDGLIQRKDKRVFAAFSLEKEESSFFEKKEAKKLLFLVVGLGMNGTWAGLAWAVWRP